MLIPRHPGSGPLDGGKTLRLALVYIDGDVLSTSLIYLEIVSCVLTLGQGNVIVFRSILHHVFLRLFIKFLSIIMLFGVILMPFLSLFARNTPRGRIPAAGNLDLEKLHQATYSAQLQMS